MFHNSAKILIAGAIAALIASSPAIAQQKLKIGFVTTLSGPAGIIGKHMKDSVELALDDLGHKVGGIPTEVIYGDDQFKPDVGLQVAEEMMKKDQVDIVAGIIWSNVMMAVEPAVTATGRIMVGTNAGASPLAGKQCDERFFTTSWKNDESPEAMGKFMQDQKMQRRVRDGAELPGRQGHGCGIQTLLQGPHRRRGVHQARAAGLPGRNHANCARRSRRRSSRSIRAAWVCSSSSSTTRPASGARSRSTRCSRWTRPRFRLSRTTRSVKWEARFWSPDLKVPAQPEVRRRIPQEVWLHALLLRRAELRRHHADRRGGTRGQGQSSRTPRA